MAKKEALDDKYEPSATDLLETEIFEQGLEDPTKETKVKKKAKAKVKGNAKTKNKTKIL